MEPEALGLGQLSQLPDGVHHPVGIGWRGPDQHDGVLGDGIGHGGDVRTKVRALGHPGHVQPQVRRSPVEGGMGRPGCHYLRCPCRRPVGPIPVARGLYRQKNTLGPVGAHAPGCPVSAVEQLRGHAHHLGLQALKAGPRPGVDRVLHEEHVIRVPCHLDHVVPSEVH